MKKDTINKSISTLEGWKWKGEIPVQGKVSSVEWRYYQLHNVPVCDLDWSDIRFLIGQLVALEWLVPIALEYLENDLFVETEYYPGDLLKILLLAGFDSTKKLKQSYWTSHPTEKQRLIDLYTQQEHVMNDWDDYDTRKKIKKAFKEFAED